MDWQSEQPLEKFVMKLVKKTRWQKVVDYFRDKLTTGQFRGKKPLLTPFLLTEPTIREMQGVARFQRGLEYFNATTANLRAWRVRVLTDGGIYEQDSVIFVDRKAAAPDSHLTIVFEALEASRRVHVKVLMFFDDQMRCVAHKACDVRMVRDDFLNLDYTINF
jgi:hypothetical protein